jgi:hypothetical protein
MRVNRLGDPARGVAAEHFLAGQDARQALAPSFAHGIRVARATKRGDGEIGGDRRRRVQIELSDQVEQQLAAGLAERLLSRQNPHADFWPPTAVAACPAAHYGPAAAGGSPG